MLFLSTPHRGTDLARFLNRILTFSMIASPKQYIAEIEQNSTNIEQLNEEFRNFADRLDIFSFYETLKTTVGHKRVGKVTRYSVYILRRETILPLTYRRWSWKRTRPFWDIHARSRSPYTPIITMSANTQVHRTQITKVFDQCSRPLSPSI